MVGRALTLTRTHIRERARRLRIAFFSATTELNCEVPSKCSSIPFTPSLLPPPGCSWCVVSRTTCTKGQTRDNTVGRAVENYFGVFHPQKRARALVHSFPIVYCIVCSGVSFLPLATRHHHVCVCFFCVKMCACVCAMFICCLPFNFAAFRKIA